MDTVVITLGGSILLTEQDDGSYIGEVAEVLKELSGEMRLIVVVGGGPLARRYIDVARRLGSDEATLDELGIVATRINSRLMITALGMTCNPAPPRDYDEALTLSGTFPIVVMGGVSPGYTTDAVAALLAERARSPRLVVATNVDAVYSEDPKKNPDAERYETLDHDRLLEITGPAGPGAGSNAVVDPLACRVAARSRMTVCVVHGRDLDSLRKAIRGEPFTGTVVR